MKIYLDNNVRQIKVFRDLVTLLEGVIKSDITLLNQINSLDDLYKVTKITNPVKNFLNYYIRESGLNKSDDWVDYASNVLYTSKGYTKTIDNLGELLDIDVHYTYDFPVLEVISFSRLVTSNLNEYVSRLENMLNYLLFFTELSIELNELILSITGTLVNYKVDITNNFRVNVAKIK